ncbi:DUF4913 domain-containing protein [Nocardia wallacei]|uniref:DUF4913 domain-containing protein n=1 Tax=Nocardia wallacei TaxID=480035 RepID=UPI002455A4B3|nr:DUF4913 domain-containing protein [Nocardia wallacei]
MTTAPTPHCRREPVTGYPSLGAFLADRLSVIFARQVTDLADVVWCPEWWLHPEAVERLWIVWQAWEELALLGPVGMSDWWQWHCEPHMARLMDPRGPFKYCSVRHGHKPMLNPLPFNLDRAPREVFTPHRPAAPVAVA